ncbi:unnamed protein product [Rhizoctonia solani]|uniref:Integral membrane bound transporter domain-containing protein n=1 Tax=Rhizoctonia solani TaxID=456999 RepID=A0A8H3A6S0_9AGAM|nr:unnamed protein product [Rhizoctonia solani]
MPRLTLASRAISFIGIWHVARAPGTLEWDYHNFTELLFAFSIAGAASLLVSLVAQLFTHPGGYANDLVDVVEIIKDLLQHSTSQTITNGQKSTLQTGTLHSKSLDKALALHISYAYSVYELRVGKVPVKAIKPLLITVNRIREALAWGKAPALEGTETPSRESSTLAQLDDPCSACAIAIADGISTLQAAVGKCFGIRLPNDTHKTIDLDDPLMAQTNIENARAGLKAALNSIVHETNKTCTLGRVESHHKELFRKSLYSVSLLQISSELIHALALAHDLLTIHHAAPRPYIFFPRPSWFWLGMSPRSVVAEEDIPSTPRSVTETGTEFGEDRLLFDEARMAPLPVPTTTAHGRKWSLVNVMCTPAMLHARTRLSNWLWRARHSKDLQFAFKHALGIAILMIPAVLPESSSAKQYYDSSYDVWAIISFVYVIEPNTALTWRTAIWRVFGTGLGALYAFAAWYIVGTNPYGVVVLAAEIFITWLVRSSTPGVGIVASITIPPLYAKSGVRAQLFTGNAADGTSVKRDTGGLPDTVFVAVEMKVMVTYNIRTDLDAADGARGTVVQVITDDSNRTGSYTAHIQELNRPPICVLVKLWSTKVKKLGDLDEEVIPIVPIWSQVTEKNSSYGGRNFR